MSSKYKDFGERKTAAEKISRRMILYRLPDCFELQNVESDGEYYEDCKADPSPFLQFCFRRFALVLAEESLARTAQSVDTLRVARLQHDANYACKRGNTHKNNHGDAKSHIQPVRSLTGCRN